MNRTLRPPFLLSSLLSLCLLAPACAQPVAPGPEVAAAVAQLSRQPTQAAYLTAIAGLYRAGQRPRAVQVYAAALRKYPKLELPLAAEELADLAADPDSSQRLLQLLSEVRSRVPTSRLTALQVAWLQAAAGRTDVAALICLNVLQPALSGPAAPGGLSPFGRSALAVLRHIASRGAGLPPVQKERLLPLARELEQRALGEQKAELPGLYLLLGEPAEAFRAWGELPRGVDSGDPALALRLGNALHELGRVEEARTVVRETLRAGMAACIQGRPEAFLQRVEAAAALPKTAPLAREALAELLAEAKPLRERLAVIYGLLALGDSSAASAALAPLAADPVVAGLPPLPGAALHLLASESARGAGQMEAARAHAEAAVDALGSSPGLGSERDRNRVLAQLGIALHGAPYETPLLERLAEKAPLLVLALRPASPPAPGALSRPLWTSLLRRAAAAAPGSLDLQRAMAQELTAAGDIPGAAPYLQAAVAAGAGPELVAALEEAAVADAAHLPLLEEVARRNPLSLPAQFAWSRARLQAEKPDRVLYDLLAHVRSRLPTPLGFAEVGKFALFVGRRDTALACFQEASRRLPTHAGLQAAAGRVLNREARSSRAIGKWRRAGELLLKFPPREGDGLPQVSAAEVGAALGSLGDRPFGIKFLEGWLKAPGTTLPGRIAARTQLALLWMGERQPQRAAAVFPEARPYVMGARPANRLWLADSPAGGDPEPAVLRLPPPLVVVGQAWAAANMRFMAMQAFHAVLLRHPERDDAFAGYADAAHRLGRLEAAQQVLEEQVEQHPYENRPRIWLGWVLDRLGRTDDAIRLYRQAIDLDPGDSRQYEGAAIFRAYRFLGSALERKGDHAAAEKYARLAEAAGFAMRGDQMAALGEARAAVELYYRALGSADDAYPVLTRAALRLEALGDRKQAASMRRQVYEMLAENWGVASTDQAGGKALLGSPRHAREALDVLEQEAPASRTAHTWHLLGRLHALLPEPEHQMAAEQALREAVRQEPRHAEAWRSLAELAEADQQWEAAVEARRTLAALQPNAVEERQALAAAYQSAGRPAEAGEQWLAAVRLDPRLASRRPADTQLAGSPASRSDRLALALLTISALP